MTNSADKKKLNLSKPVSPNEAQRQSHNLIQIVSRHIDLKRGSVTNELIEALNHLATLIKNDPNQNLAKASPKQTDIHEVVFSGLNLECLSFRHKRLIECVFNYSKLSEVDFSNSRLDGSSFVKADLSFSKLQNSSARHTDFEMATLYSADLSKADFYGANFTNSDLRFANLTGSNLKNANLTGILKGETAFERTIQTMDIRGADLTGAYVLLGNKKVILTNQNIKNLIGKTHSISSCGKTNFTVQMI